MSLTREIDKPSKIKNSKQSNISLAKAGKDFEKLLTPKLKTECTKLGYGFVRFYDSYSSQGFRLPAQPSDFHITTKGSKGHFVEFKFVHEEVFSFQKLNDKQWGGLLESIEFGYNYWVLVYSGLTEHFYLMHSTEVLNYFSRKLVRSRQFSLMDAIKLDCFHVKSIDCKNNDTRQMTKAVQTILKFINNF
jgi:hypothetical protein